MSYSFLHNHGSNFQSVLIFAQLSDEVDLEGRPLIFENCEFCIQLDFEGVILTYLQEIVLFGIATFDRNTKSVFLGIVTDVNNLKGQSDNTGSYFFQSGDIGIVNDFSFGFHSDMITFLDEVVNMP